MVFSTNISDLVSKIPGNAFCQNYESEIATSHECRKFASKHTRPNVTKNQIYLPIALQTNKFTKFLNMTDYISPETIREISKDQSHFHK